MWTTLKAPSLAEMESMTNEIFEGLPARFRELCEGLIIRVDDFPTEEVLDEPGGWSTVTMAISERAWLDRLLLRLGRAAEVISPAAERDAAVTAARSLLQRY